jgi:probable addiction module antidote protein/putative addiction module killer protein
MVEVRQTEEFSGWLHRLRDANAVARIVGRIRRIEMGNPGDTRGVGHGILEMRVDYGPGYRIYYVHRGAQILILVWWRQAHATEGYQTGSEAGGDIVMPKTLMPKTLMPKALMPKALMPKTTRFDAADYLDTEERQVAYIAAALESGDADFVRDALGLVARARGMGGIAKKAGLNRESLYKALGETGNPEFGTVMRIVRALGLTLSAHPVASGQTSKRRRVA